jgi:hypothetical protein
MSSSPDLEFQLPDLRIVPVESLRPHERNDPQRMQPLARKIREQAMIRNPPVVAALSATGSSDGFVVLDGANRVGAARACGLPHMVVQVVRYEAPFVELRTWYHALGEIGRAQFERAAEVVPGLTCRAEDPLHARALLARREVLATVEFREGGALTFSGGRDLGERNNLLNAVVDAYHDRQRFYRMSTDSLEVATSRYPEVTALVVFPHFEPAEVVELATRGDTMPAGITRHLIRWRALRVNLAIDLLVDPRRGLDDKNRWLREWREERLARRELRFYEEPTVLFDE